MHTNEAQGFLPTRHITLGTSSQTRGQVQLQPITSSLLNPGEGLSPYNMTTKFNIRKKHRSNDERRTSNKYPCV